MTTPIFTVQEAFTLHFKNTAMDYRELGELHGNKMVRLQQLKDGLQSYLRHTSPHVIISESPFMGRMATAFRALTECLLVIQQTVMEYDIQLPLLTASPYEVKQGAGVILKGKTGLSKDDIRSALLRNSLLAWKIDPLILDEHSIDATAVALTYLRGECQI
jgi:Holliday junction resolvasome RuvABC endonuclease subunit